MRSAKLSDFGLHVVIPKTDIGDRRPIKHALRSPGGTGLSPTTTILFFILPALVIVYIIIIQKLTSPRTAHPVSLRRIRSRHDMHMSPEKQQPPRSPSRTTRPPSRSAGNPHASAQENPRGNPSSYTPNTLHKPHPQSSQPPAYPPLPSSSQGRGHHHYSSQGHSRGHHRETDPLVSAKRRFLQQVATETINAINAGAVIFPDPQNENGVLKRSIRRETTKMRTETQYFSPNSSILANWDKRERRFWKRPGGGQVGVGAGMGEPHHPIKVSIMQMSTLDGARYLHSDLHSSLTPPSSSKKIGVLNFASATSPGGGFINGAQAQEESIARSSNLYVSLITQTANPFYALHAREDKGGYYSHAMIYSPEVLVFRDDKGAWIPPYPIDVVTSPAVNAGQVRKLRRRPKAEVEARILEVMRERMGRILALFENRGAKHLVLGSFGTGVFQNDVKALAGIWAELLVVPGARFTRAFETVVFTIPDEGTKKRFEAGFGGRAREGGGG